MKLDNNAKMLISLLENNGYKAYAVGGCVRDALMGIEPKDVDITTSALPLETEKVLENNGIRFIETGLKHGTITALVDHIPFEITTFRTDGKYNDNRHPEKVEFVKDIREDLARRDFTINAIAYNDSQLVDYFNGVEDIERKIIKAVGDPDERFKEDALRIMRAIRFSSVLGFEIEENTSNAIFRNKELLKNIAVERIYVELVKLLLGDNCEEVLLKYRDVIAVVIPELVPTFDYPQNSKWHIYDVYTHIVKSVAVSPKKDYIRLALLLHDIAKSFTKTVDEKGDHFYGHPLKSAKIATDILKRLKVSNDVSKKVITLIENHDNHITHKAYNIKKWLRLFGEELTFDFIDLKIADLATHNYDLSAPEIEELKHIKELTNNIIDNNEPYRISDLAINGSDLMELGYTGKEIANELEKLVEYVSANPKCNTKEKLINLATKDKSV